MSLSRVGVRNVYGTSQQAEFYGNVDREDPEAVLNGVAVSGLIGVLRQLGDLAESAAEIFQGIQEEVMATASRSNQLKIRLQHIEATVPPLEKAVLAQTTHLHFAYTGGVEWHPRIPHEQNHLIHDDLPHFIMDPYEECRDPPRLHLLDKFDINGPGSCLKRYSDPTYFRRASSNLMIQENKKFQTKNYKIKKKKSSSRSRDMSRLASSMAAANQNARKTFTLISFSGQTSSSKTASTSDMEKISDLQDHHSHSFDSRSGSTATSSSLKTGEKPKGGLVSSSLTPGSCTIASVLSESETEDGKDSFNLSPSQGQAAAVGSSCVSWDEKAEIVEEPLGVLQTGNASEMMETNSAVDGLDERASYGEGTGRVDRHSNDIESESGKQQQSNGIDEVREIKTGLEMVREPRDSSEHETESEGECFVDALNCIESESENDQGLKTSQEEAVSSSPCGVVTDERLENSVCEQELEQGCVEESCSRSMDKGSVNATDEMNHQDLLESTDLSGGEDNTACTFVPAPENSLSDSSNPLLCHSEHQNSEAKVPREVEAIKIWTNGSLLGLNPSKPPVLEVPSSAEAEKDKSDDVVEHVLDASSLASQNVTVDERECHETTSSYGVFGGLSQKLFTNSFRRRDTLSHDNRQALPATIPENREVTEKSRFGGEQDIDWTPSSPPLQHMKISLNPVDNNTLQASSRLKLKISAGDDDTFSSFQLLPEAAATSVLDSCSDDDTFCRSSPYMSDTDYHSDNQSLSGSEQWEESSHSHERKDQELYADNNGEGASLDTVTAINFSYLQSPVEPLPPPFPPAQWMVSKTASETISENKTAQPLQLQDALRFAFEKHTSSSIVKNKEEPNTVASSAPKPETKVVHVKKNNVREEDKQNANEKETDAEDFLQQIRTQHVNLRPVVMTTTLSSAAAATTDPAINIKISAMLEKANSIRQAVASNDGDESDTWSDT
ncbi:Protein SCAR3 [Raphanus sativus]|uniref:Protein SCAR n=1 Tax=Raphanus sativus TaxID=3726 RepID=A0A9W3D3Y8_RAPSA|nr:protein SCAR3-like [Raphanus sativus]KAJ4865989.1 Protein SCAR3 [Raphanus sativus]